MSDNEDEVSNWKDIKHYWKDRPIYGPELSRPWAGTQLERAYREAAEKLIRQNQIAVETLTETQLVEAIRQAIACGDIMRHVRVDNQAQAVTWVPYRREQELLSRINQLEAQILEAGETPWPE